MNSRVDEVDWRPDTVAVGPGDFEFQLKKSWRQTLLLFALTVLFPTAMIYVLSKRFGFTVSVINLDLLALCVISALIARKFPRTAAAVAALGVGVIVGLQVLLAVGLVYIDDPALIGEYLQFAAHWPWGLIATWGAVGMAAVGLLFLSLRKVKMTQVRAMPALVLLVALLTMDLVGRTELGFSLIKINPTTSTAARSLGVLKSWARNPGFTHVTHPGQSMAGRLAHGAPIPDKILSISVEAFGLANDKAFNNDIARPLERRLGGLYAIERGSHPYKGATLAGELRELCGLRITGTPTRAASDKISPNCLPARLQKMGYKTTAMHGNSRFFYNRSELYSALGFQKSYFYEDFSAQGAKVCNTRSFAGTCDNEVLQVAMKSLQRGPKAFVHVMTLETHFPLTAVTPQDKACNAGADSEARALCVYKNSFSRTMETIASSIESAKVQPDVVYIYGDHAPPYVVAQERAFFDRHNVPVIVLRRLDGRAG